MLPETVTLALGLDDDDDDASLRKRVAKQLKVDSSELPHLRVLKRSVDARHKRIRFQLVIGLKKPKSSTLGTPEPKRVTSDRHALIVGAGPAGLFCAYQLAPEGIRCTLLDLSLIHI